jgi:hypothetical protein
MTCPAFHIPTDAELQASSAAWLVPLRPCLYTYWPERYKEMSFRTVVEEMREKDLQRLIETFDGKPLGKPEDGALIWKLNRGLSVFTSGSFFKLESRKPQGQLLGRGHELPGLQLAGHGEATLQRKNHE